MAFKYKDSSGSLIDVLDRVLDKGIVIDASIRVALAGIDLVSVHARIVVASIDTYFVHAEALPVTSSLADTPLAFGTQRFGRSGRGVLHH